MDPPPPGFPGRGRGDLRGGGGACFLGTGFTPGGSSTPWSNTTEETPAGMEAIALAAGSSLDPTVATKRLAPFAENCSR